MKPGLSTAWLQVLLWTSSVIILGKCINSTTLCWTRARANVFILTNSLESNLLDLSLQPVINYALYSIACPENFKIDKMTFPVGKFEIKWISRENKREIETSDAYWQRSSGQTNCADPADSARLSAAGGISTNIPQPFMLILLWHWYYNDVI